MTALKPESQIFQYPIQWLPKAPTLDNFTNVLANYPIGLWFFNSMIVALLTTAISLVMC